jgi:hypothetical protein
MAGKKSDTERLADELVKGLGFTKRKKAEHQLALRRDGKVIAEVLTRRDFVRVNLAVAPSAKAIRALKLEAEPVREVRGEPQNARWKFGLVVRADNFDAARKLLEEL